MGFNDIFTYCRLVPEVQQVIGLSKIVRSLIPNKSLDSEIIKIFYDSLEKEGYPLPKPNNHCCIFADRANDFSRLLDNHFDTFYGESIKDTLDMIVDKKPSYGMIELEVPGSDRVYRQIRGKNPCAVLLLLSASPEKYKEIATEESDLGMIVPGQTDFFLLTDRIIASLQVGNKTFTQRREELKHASQIIYAAKDHLTENDPENPLLYMIIDCMVQTMPQGFETGKAVLDDDCADGAVVFYINPNHDYSK